jgi:hypothetical protein
VQRSFMQNRRDTALNFLPAYLESIKRAKETPEFIIDSIAKRMKVSADIVRPAYQPHANVLKSFPMSGKIRCRPSSIFISETNSAAYCSKSSSTTVY